MLSVNIEDVAASVNITHNLTFVAYLMYWSICKQIYKVRPSTFFIIFIISCVHSK